MAKIHCPYCGFWFKVLATNSRNMIPDLAPIVCESCGEVGLLVEGLPRKLETGELELLKKAPVWKDFIEPVLDVINKERSKRQ